MNRYPADIATRADEVVGPYIHQMPLIRTMMQNWGRVAVGVGPYCLQDSPVGADDLIGPGGLGDRVVALR